MNRQMKKKKLLCDTFKKVPVISFACNHTGVSRDTYYRWIKEDLLFKDEVNKSIAESIENGFSLLAWNKFNHSVHKTKTIKQKIISFLSKFISQ